MARTLAIAVMGFTLGFACLVAGLLDHDLGRVALSGSFFLLGLIFGGLFVWMRRSRDPPPW